MIMLGKDFFLLLPQHYLWRIWLTMMLGRNLFETGSNGYCFNPMLDLHWFRGHHRRLSFADSQCDFVVVVVTCSLYRPLAIHFNHQGSYQHKCVESHIIYQDRELAEAA